MLFIFFNICLFLKIITFFGNATSQHSYLFQIIIIFFYKLVSEEQITRKLFLLLLYKKTKYSVFKIFHYLKYYL